MPKQLMLKVITIYVNPPVADGSTLTIKLFIKKLTHHSLQNTEEKRKFPQTGVHII